MPLFMDYYINPSEETMEELIPGRKTGFPVHNKYGVEFKNIWISEDRCMIFCLMEAPDKDSCARLHHEACGNGELNVVEVTPNNFYTPLLSENTGEGEEPCDSGYRTLLLFEKIGTAISPLFEIRKIERIITRHEGALYLDPHPATRAQFIFPAPAILCAAKIKYYMAKRHPADDYRIAIVSEKTVQNHTFYDYATDLSEKILKSGHKGTIRTTQLTCDLLKKEKGSCGMYLNDIEVLSHADEQLLYQILEYIENNYHDPGFNAGKLGALLGSSRSQLFRKIKQLTSYTPNLLIREVRLYEALKLLKQNAENRISQIAYHTGFNSPSYFAKLFAHRFGILPSDLREETILP